MLGLEALQEFLNRGGPVLLAIMAATFVMWALILERLFYFRLAHKGYAEQALAAWHSRTDHKSTYAHWIKDKLVSEVRQRAEANVGFTKALVALAPLLGLLGTVTGMVTVFDYMAITDGADAKAMSRGVSQATIPTMAGMVASISGILFTSGMDRKVGRLIQKLNDEMEID
ncbi:MAG: MotA/TolQ/ExbB proton channel family protein [Henriciella sp.]|jgi:biopolymer transport protein ExbB